MDWKRRSGWVHRLGIVVLVLVLAAMVLPAFVAAQGPFPPPPAYPPAMEGWRSTYSQPIGGYQYMRTYMQNWQQLSDVTDYGWSVLGHRAVYNGGVWVTAARAAQSTAPVWGMSMVPAVVYDYSQQVSYDWACAGTPGGCGPF